MKKIYENIPMKNIYKKFFDIFFQRDQMKYIFRLYICEKINNKFKIRIYINRSMKKYKKTFI